MIAKTHSRRHGRKLRPNKAQRERVTAGWMEKGGAPRAWSWSFTPPALLTHAAAAFERNQSLGPQIVGSRKSRGIEGGAISAAVTYVLNRHGRPRESKAVEPEVGVSNGRVKAAPEVGK